MTRPVLSNRFGLSIEEAKTIMRSLREAFTLLDDVPGPYDTWAQLVVENRVSGKQAHDANPVAAMRTHGLSTMLTLDEAGFGRYDGLHILKP